MKFDKILSHNNSPQQQNYYVQAKPTFVPPPLGLDVVTMPNGNIFDLFLKGRITAKQMLNMDVKEVSRVLRESPRRLTRHKSIKKNQSDQIFNLVERFQQQRKQTINFSQIQKQKPQPKLSRKETLMQLTSSTKELLQPIAQSRFRTPARKFSQRSTASGKEEQLITRYEKLSGERLKEEEKELLLKKEITDDDVWKMMNIFSKKKWFFDYIHRNLDQQNEPKLPTEEKQTQAVSLFQRLRNTVLKQQEGKKRKPEKQCQEYYAHIQNIEDSIKNSVFKREMPEQIRFQNKPNVKEFRSESVVSKLNIRNQFLQSADNFNVNSSNPNILHQVYEEGSQTCKMPTTARKHKLFTRRNPRASLSREIDISHESQSDSYKSITEYRLNELYRESNQRQKQYQQKYDTGTIFNGDQLQRKVKNLVKIGNIQKTILNVVSQKLQQ